QGFTGHPIQDADPIALVLAQPLHVCVRMAGSAGEYKFYRSVHLFIGLNQQIAVLLRREAAEEQNVRPGLETPLSQPPARAPLAQRSPVGHIRWLRSIVRAVIL